MSEIRRNTSSEAAFRKRFFQWFDGFLAMKFVHYARDRFHGDGNLCEQAARLLAIMGRELPAGAEVSVRELLPIYRELDRGTQQNAG